MKRNGESVHIANIVVLHMCNAQLSKKQKKSPEFNYFNSFSANIKFTLKSSGLEPKNVRFFRLGVFSHVFLYFLKVVNSGGSGIPQL